MNNYNCFVAGMTFGCAEFVDDTFLKCVFLLLLCLLTGNESFIDKKNCTIYFVLKGFFQILNALIYSRYNRNIL